MRLFAPVLSCPVAISKQKTRKEINRGPADQWPRKDFKFNQSRWVRAILYFAPEYAAAIVSRPGNIREPPGHASSDAKKCEEVWIAPGCADCQAGLSGPIANPQTAFSFCPHHPLTPLLTLCNGDTPPNYTWIRRETLQPVPRRPPPRWAGSCVEGC